MRKATLLFAAIFPILGQQPADRFSHEKELALGRALAADLRRESPPIEDPLLTAYVTDLANRLNERARSPFPLSLDITRETKRRDSDAIPGGFLRLPIGAIASSATERELALIIAHGIAHIAARHGVRNAARTQDQGLATIPLIFFGHGHIGHAIIPRGLLPYYQQAEQEAENQAAALLDGFETGTGFEAARERAREIVKALEPIRHPPTLRRANESRQ